MHTQPREGWLWLQMARLSVCQPIIIVLVATPAMAAVRQSDASDPVRSSAGVHGRKSSRRARPRWAESTLEELGPTQALAGIRGLASPDRSGPAGLLAIDGHDDSEAALLVDRASHTATQPTADSRTTMNVLGNTASRESKYQTSKGSSLHAQLCDASSFITRVFFRRILSLISQENMVHVAKRFALTWPRRCPTRLNVKS